MNHKKTIGIYGIIAVLSVGLIGAYGFSMNPQSGMTQTTTDQNMALLGHVTMAVTDQQGHIKEYRQGDNVVVNVGKDCAAKKIFGTTSGGNCPSTVGNTYNVIAIGTGAAPTATSHTLTTETAATGLGRAAASSDTITTAGASGVSTVATLSKQFTNTSGGSVTISEAGIFNSTTNDASSGMFSGQGFTGIALANNDALTVTWTISVG